MTGTVPPVPQVPAGWEPDVADFETWITDPFQFLSTKPLFRAQLQAAQAFAAGTWTPVHLDTVLEDPYSGWSATATSAQPAYSWLCPPGCSGWYEVTVSAHAAEQSSGTGQIGAAVWLDGALWWQPAQLIAAGTQDGGASGAAWVPMTGGQDYLQLYQYVTSAESAPAAAGQYPSMEISWLST